MCNCNNIELIPIKELFGSKNREKTEYSFFLPEYQRGYRWEKKHVEALLNDILFFCLNKKSQDKYCLQPIVVKDKNGKYELIDGQQRLTTIYLIACAFRPFTDEFGIIYNLEYGSRENTSDNLKKIKEELNVDIDVTQDIDSYYIKNAYDVIKKWKEEQIQKIDGFYLKFLTTLFEDTQIIWYEIKEKKSLPVAVFKRLNKGRIPLDDSELIKALFLKSADGDKELSEEHKFALATQWDYVEKELQNDDFWFFLSNEEKSNNRIELILDIISSKNELNNMEEHFTFKFFEKLSNKSFEEKQKVWQIIMDYFYLFKGWYEDRTLYNLIGYLIAIGTKLSEIYNLVKPNNNIDIDKPEQRFNTITKADFIKKLKEKIKEEVIDKIDIAKENKKYNYTNSGKLIRKVLLLHNVLTILKNEKSSSYKFLFKEYKNVNWDIEHISPVHTGEDKLFSRAYDRIVWFHDNVENEDIRKALVCDKKELYENFENWYREVKAYNKEKGDKEKEYSLKNDSENHFEKQFDEYYNQVVEYFNKDISSNDDNCLENETEDDKETRLNNREQNQIGNLVLLDSGTNREYKNALFPVKRKTIIEYDQTNKFVPLCTKNVILKYYSTDNDVLVWNLDNLRDYKKNIEDVIKDFVKGIDN